jgi:anaerobic selenocysteine-containing dehydrogenase
MGKMTRRDFLKIGFTSAASIGLGGSLTSCFSPPPEVPRKMARTAGMPVNIASTCLLCPAGCGILGEVIDGRVSKIVGNPKDPNSRGKICSRGHAGVNVLYDPDRLLYPFKRSGARGEGRWARITWQQALDEMAKKLGSLRQQGKTEALWVEQGVAAEHELLFLHFLKAYGSPTIFADSSFPRENKALGQALTWGAEPLVSDAAKSRFILNFGANPYENHEEYIPLAQRIVEGRLNNGAKLVTFDVRLSNTAGKSQEWIPLKPGTDGIVALAMAHHILQQGLQDREFLNKWTNVPAPKLMEHLAPYTPEQAEKASGVKAAEIRRIAMELAQTKPATILTGRGVSGHQNGCLNERCMALLCAVIGNIDIPGGNCLPRVLDLGEPKMKGSFASSPQAFSALKEGKKKPEIFLVHMANPVYANPGTSDVVQILKDEKKVPFLVVADTNLTETGALADLLLPMSTYLESWNLETRAAMNLIPFASIRQPMVGPLGKSMAMGDAVLELAARMGDDLPKTLPYRKSEEFIDRMAARIEGLPGASGIQELKKEGLWMRSGGKPQYRIFEKRGFPTPTGKGEIFSKRLQDRGLPAMPVYNPIQDHQDLKEGELILTIHRVNVMTLELANAKWLAEIFHANPLWMNPRTAEARGIREGDRIKITSKAGTVTAKVRFSQGVHPGSITMAEGLGHTELGKIAKGKAAKTADLDTNLVWWEKEGNGVNPHGVIPLELDPIAGGQAWNDTKVTVTKA